MIEEILEIAPPCRVKVFANRCVRVPRLDLLIGFSWLCATLFEYFVLYWWHNASGATLGLLFQPYISLSLSFPSSRNSMEPGIFVWNRLQKRRLEIHCYLLIGPQVWPWSVSYFDSIDSRMPRLRSPIRKFIMQSLDIEHLDKSRLNACCQRDCKQTSGNIEKKLSDRRRSRDPGKTETRPRSPRVMDEEERADIEQAKARFDRAVVDQEKSLLEQKKIIADQREAKARQMEWEEKIARLESDQVRRVQDQERWRQTARRQFEMPRYRDERKRHTIHVQPKVVYYEWPKPSHARVSETVRRPERQNDNWTVYRKTSSMLQRPLNSPRNAEVSRKPQSRVSLLSRDQIVNSVRYVPARPRQDQQMKRSNERAPSPRRPGPMESFANEAIAKARLRPTLKPSKVTVSGQTKPLKSILKPSEAVNPRQRNKPQKRVRFEDEEQRKADAARRDGKSTSESTSSSRLRSPPPEGFSRSVNGERPRYPDVSSLLSNRSEASRPAQSPERGRSAAARSSSSGPHYMEHERRVSPPYN